MPQPPSLGAVSSPYGMRVNPNDGVWRMHYGEDTLGEGNYAPATGTVVFAGWDKTGTGLGWAVGVRETMNPSVIWWVAHHGTTALWSPLKVSVGSKVSQRFTYLGPKGSTGAAKGDHAHTERRVNGAERPGSGTATNPRSYYGGGFSGGGITPIPDFVEEEDDMSIRVITHVRDDGTAEEVALISPQFAGGYITAKGGTEVAAGWLRTYSPKLDGTPHQKLNRDQYLGAIAAAKVAAAAYQSGLPTSGGVVAVDQTELLAALGRVEAAVNRLNPPG